MITNTYTGVAYSNPSLMPGGPNPLLTSGTMIVGLLSTPEFVDAYYQPTTAANAAYSNRMVAYVYSINGPAVEKPPQANDNLVRQDSFSYRILCVNAPPATNTNMLNSAYEANLLANLHELRLTFEWPQLPNGGVGFGRQTFRATVAGQVVTNIVAGQTLYFYQSQSFTNAP